MESTRLEKLFEELCDSEIKPRLMMTQVLNPGVSADICKITRDALRSYPFRERLNLHADVKDNEKAAQLRTEGNKMFHPNVKRYIEALKLYNESITLSEKGSEERALAYGNRSIICLEMQRYEGCLENIRLARESNYPERLKEKLDDRENTAKKALAKMADQKESTSKDSSEAVDELQQSYPSHENAPQIANCLELHKNDQYGRHVVTNRKLNVGDVVMIDKPYVTVLDEMLRCVRCDFCHAERLFTLIPCEGCSWVMYCSEECKSQAYNKYHRYECGVQRDLGRFGLDLSGLRILATTIAIFDNDPEALKDHLDSLDEANFNSFTMDWRHAAPKDIFNAIQALTVNQSKNIRNNLLLLRMFVASIIHNVVLERTELGTIAGSKPEIADMFFDLILRYMEIPTHMSKVLVYNKDEGMYQLDKLASETYPLLNLLNHSCAPNVMLISLRDGRCAVLVSKPIPKGGQLFTTYDDQIFLGKGRNERQQYLSDKFNFHCTCEACVNDYPRVIDMTEILQNLHDLDRSLGLNNLNYSSNACRKRISKGITRLQTELNDAAKYFPAPAFFIKQFHHFWLYTMLYSQTSENADYLKYCNP